MAEPTSTSSPSADSPALAGAVAAGSGAISAGSSDRSASGPTTVGPRGAGSTSGSGAGGLVPTEWPAQAADAIVDTIGKVRNKTTKPAVTAARSVVYGMLAGIVGIVALVLVLILLVRLYANYVPGDVWPLYAALFVALSIAGIVLLRKANRPATST